MVIPVKPPFIMLKKILSAGWNRMGLTLPLAPKKTLVLIMNYAIEFHDAKYPFLDVAARKKKH